MKTLDEVIKGMEHCHEDNCMECPYQFEPKDFDCITQCQYTDVLHYLKEYRSKQDTIAEQLAELKQKNDHVCEMAKTVCEEYDRLCNRLAEEYRNDALSWDELKGMEGKPVWVELYGSDFDEWVLIHAWNDDIMWFADCNGTLYTEKECRLGQTWQAYRKERE